MLFDLLEFSVLISIQFAERGSGGGFRFLSVKFSRHNDKFNKMVLTMLE